MQATHFKFTSRTCRGTSTLKTLRSLSSSALSRGYLFSVTIVEAYFVEYIRSSSPARGESLFAHAVPIFLRKNNKHFEC